MKIAVFCSANNVEENYVDLASRLGTWIGANGHELVFGGRNIGLMAVIGKAVRKSGGRSVGVVPMLFGPDANADEILDVEIPCSTLADRKQIIIDRCDVAVALPGGIGTLDEVFTMAAMTTVGLHRKRVILWDINGFWQPLIALLNHLQAHSLLRGGIDDMFAIAANEEQLIGMLEKVK